MMFTGISGNEYRVWVANYDGKQFQQWEDGSTDRTRTVTLTANTILTATYDLGDALYDFTPMTYTGTEGRPSLTVNAMSTDGEALHMWTIIDPQSTEGQETTYKVYAGEYQDMTFDHWEDGSTSKTRTLTIGEDTAITAYYQSG